MYDRLPGFPKILKQTVVAAGIKGLFIWCKVKCMYNRRSYKCITDFSDLKPKLMERLKVKQYIFISILTVYRNFHRYEIAKFKSCYL